MEILQQAVDISPRRQLALQIREELDELFAVEDAFCPKLVQPRGNMLVMSHLNGSNSRSASVGGSRGRGCTATTSQTASELSYLRRQSRTSWTKPSMPFSGEATRPISHLASPGTRGCARWRRRPAGRILCAQCCSPDFGRTGSQRRGSGLGSRAGGCGRGSWTECDGRGLRSRRAGR